MRRRTTIPETAVTTATEARAAVKVGYRLPMTAARRLPVTESSASKCPKYRQVTGEAGDVVSREASGHSLSFRDREPRGPRQTSRDPYASTASLTGRLLAL